jgi:hypothetical protein
MPQHRHATSFYYYDGYPDHGFPSKTAMLTTTGYPPENKYTNYQGSSSSHNHGNTGYEGDQLNPRYVTVIVAIKD